MLYGGYIFFEKKKNNRFQELCGILPPSTAAAYEVFIVRVLKSNPDKDSVFAGILYFTEHEVAFVDTFRHEVFRLPVSEVKVIVNNDIRNTFKNTPAFDLGEYWYFVGYAKSLRQYFPEALVPVYALPVDEALSNQQTAKKVFADRGIAVG